MKYQLASLLLGLRRTFMKSPKGLRIAIFHDIPWEQKAGFDKFVVEAQKRWGIVSPQEAEEYLAGNAKGSPLLLTFDDGFRSNFAIATEILAKHDIRALFFVCPSLIDMSPTEQKQAISCNIFNGRTNGEQLSLMNWDELQELQRNGHVIGSHSCNHLNLAAIDHLVIESEVKLAKEAINRRLDSDAKWFAFPFGEIRHINSAALQIIGREHLYCRSGIRGINSPEVNSLGLYAQHIELSAPLAYQMLALEGGLDFRYAKARAELAEFLRL